MLTVHDSVVNAYRRIGTDRSTKKLHQHSLVEFFSLIVLPAQRIELLQFSNFDVSEFNRIAVAREPKEAAGAIFARVWCVGHEILHCG